MTLTDRIRHTGMAAALVAAALGWSAAPADAATRAAGLGVSPAGARTALAARQMRVLDGGTMSLGALHGEVVVVNFWASWCAPCRRELPALDRLHREIAAKGGRVVAVSIDEDLQAARRFARARPLALELVHDGPGGLARQLDLKNVPMTLVLDRSGAIAWTSAASDEAMMRELGAVVRRMLAAPRDDAAAVIGGNR